MPSILISEMSSSFFSSSSCFESVDSAIIRLCSVARRLVFPLLLGPRSKNVGMPSLPPPEVRVLAGRTKK